jgi:hypothetical protein
VGDKEDEGLPQVCPEAGEPAREATRNQTPKKEFFREPSFDESVEERHQNRGSAKAEASKRLLWRPIPNERAHRGWPNNENYDNGERESQTVPKVPARAESKPRSLRNLSEPAFVATLLIGEVEEERKAGDNQEIHHGRDSSVRDQVGFHLFSQASVVVPRLIFRQVIRLDISERMLGNSSLTRLREESARDSGTDR